MKFFLSTILVVAVIVTTTQGRKSKAEWHKFKANQGKSYSDETDALREEIFQKVDTEIEAHNSRADVHFKRAHNKFSDMTKEEKDKFLGAQLPSASERFLQAMTVDLSSEDRQLPASLDYRTHKCLAAVKNQKSCGSCWAFTAIAPLEFSKCNLTGSPVVLSEQQLVDCDPYDRGCNGGWYTNAWAYIQNVATGSAQQSLYTYTATKAATCQFTTSMTRAKVASFGYVQANNATAMQVALKKYGPLSVAIAVVTPFYSYASGVYTDTTCDTVRVNHGVVVVGYGALNGIDHWIVRNSWGTVWGQSGYILMQRGVNKCKIEGYPAYVVAA